MIRAVVARNLLALALVGAIAGSSAGCAAPQRSRYGFGIKEENLTGYVDVAWFAVADAATKTYGELAMLNFAARQIRFEIMFIGERGEPQITPGLIQVPWASCIADSSLLVIFAGIASNVLNRDEIGAGNKAMRPAR